MLFTVNVEQNAQPVPTPLRNLTPDYGVRSQNFILNKGKIQYEYENLPQESETGFEVIPGKDSLEIVLDLFSKCVRMVGVKGTRTLQYKEFHWPGHVYANKPIYVQYTVDRVTPRLGCVDVRWKGALKDQGGRSACEIIIKQRVYLNP